MPSPFLNQPLLGFKRSARRHPPLASDLAYDPLESRSLMCAGPALADSHALFASDTTEQLVANASTAPVSRIVNGTITNQFPSVGLIGDSTGFFCSGTLIGSRYVLTAAHCAEGVGASAGRFQIGSQIYSTSQIFVHPGYNSNLIGQDNANDIAIYKLDRDVVGIAPSPINRTTPAVGQLLTLVGFGAGGTGTSGHDGSFGTKRVGTTAIDRVSSRLISWNFDNNFESNTAPGDSGGPAFLQVNGTYVVAGVTSGGERDDAGIGDYSFDTRVDAYASWIDSIIGTTSNLPTVSITALDNVGGETATGQAANTAAFSVSRTGSLNSALTVTLVTAGNATKGVDYISLPSMVTIPAGAASTTVLVRPIDDTLTEGNETVAVSLAAGAGYQVSSTNSNLAISIIDNDTPLWNNSFASRINLSGATVTAAGTNANATREPGEPNVLNISGGKSIWWSWTAPASGLVTISTAGSNFDTTLGVYTGTSVNGLSLVRANDDQNLFGGVYTSLVNFQAVAGQRYQILVDGYRGDSGLVKLTVTQPSGRNAAALSVQNSPLRAEQAEQRRDRYQDQPVRWNLRPRETAESLALATSHAGHSTAVHSRLNAQRAPSRVERAFAPWDLALIDLAFGTR